MKFSVFCQSPGSGDNARRGDLDELFERILAAEAQGYEGAWLADPPSGERDFAPGMALAVAHLAARTERIRLGSLAALLPFMHPLRLAEARHGCKIGY